MNIEQKDIDSAVNGKYTEFSDKIKNVLHSKLNNAEDIIKYKEDFDHVQNLKSVFSEINGVNKGE